MAAHRLLPWQQETTGQDKVEADREFQHDVGASFASTRQDANMHMIERSYAARTNTAGSTK